MKLEEVLTDLHIPHTPKMQALELYEVGRQQAIDRFAHKYQGQFQSPSIAPSTKTQRSSWQNEQEHSVYQRSDYTPSRSEKELNDLYQPLGGRQPTTLFFNSGMAAISTLLFYLFHTLKISKMVVGRNTYFESKWLFDDYGRCQYWNEYLRFPKTTAQAIWIEYPINCTSPDRYPFSRSSEVGHLEQAVTFLTQKALKKPKQEFALIIDYTLYYLPFASPLWKKLPANVSLFLVTSLQKHRNYGFDLYNGGAITFYSQNQQTSEKLKLLRAALGTCFTQESAWMHYPLQPKLINRLITDSGKLARQIFRQLPQFKGVTFYYADNTTFLSSFIFVKIEAVIMKKYTTGRFYSDRLMASIVAAAQKRHVEMIQGTSFGFPFTRIFKNSERYENTNSLRIAIGFDESLQEGVAEAIAEGTTQFLQEIQNETRKNAQE